MRLSSWVVISALTMTAVASADTVILTPDNLAANGWKSTATYVWGGSTNATVEATSHYGASNFRFVTGSMPTSWQFQWAGLSTGALAGTPLSAITSVKIKTFGLGGDNVQSWQPPSITFSLSRNNATADRNLVWIPWTSATWGASNPRAPGVWNEYDCATTGLWRSLDNNVTYSSLAAAKAVLGTATFATTAQLPVDWGYVSQHALNVGNNPLYDEQRANYSGVTGYVDWIEIGVNGVVTRYDFVPEPASLMLLAAGVVVLTGRPRRA